MTLNPGEWLRRNRGVYFGNATSVRDYRVQLRGNRSVILFGVYLVTLIGVGLVVYNGSARDGAMEVVEAQRQLQNFYNVIIALLGGLVSLIAPALTATTVVVERQRRSFDLIFSAPVTPKYFLVGKMISSFRYTWMLLVLALPVTAACVVLGGASWSDVLIAYLLLSLSGLMMTAIALLMSTISQKPVAAVLWSYAANIGFLILTSSLSTGTVVGAFMGRRSLEAPFFSTLNPFLVQYTADTYTVVGTTHVPNWIFTIFIAALVSKICLLAAGALLSPRPAEEIRSLRLHILAYVGAFVLYVSWAFGSSGIPSRASLTGDVGRDLFAAMLPLCLFMPFLSTFGVDSDRRFWPNGSFSIRRALDGTPAGGLPFTALLLLISALSVWAGLHYGGGFDLTSEFLYWMLYLAGFWFFFWSIGQYASSLFVGLRSARTMQFASFLLLVVLPISLLSSITTTSVGSNSATPWDFYMLTPLFKDRATAGPAAMCWGVLLFAVGYVLSRISASNTKRKMDLVRSRYAADF